MTTTSFDLADLFLDRVQSGLPGLDRLNAELPALLAVPIGRRDRVRCLLAAYELRTGTVTERSRLADHPAVTTLRWTLEQQWISDLESVPLPDRVLEPADGDGSGEAAARAMRRLAARDRLPAVYRWVAKTAALEEIVAFLALEGGPDAGFDDLVAACQIGLIGPAKMELARNYWDEMGDGDPQAVHTTEHTRMATALGIVGVPEGDQSVEGLERAALCGMLAANHWLQPELLGALGLTELQAGPRCRQVVQGLQRTGAPAASLTFYEVHADVDPRHGRDWLDNAVVPMVDERPEWGARVVRGAWWRFLVNARFFDTVAVGSQVPVPLAA